MPIIVTILGIIIIVMSVAFFTLSPKETPVLEDADMNRTESMELEAETEITPTAPTPTDPTSNLDDGSAAAAANVVFGASTYVTPARQTHALVVTLTLDANAVVTESKVVYDEGTGFSNPHQERFDAAYKAEVVGKPLADISLSRVGGASLTTEAFNQALTNIKNQQS